MNAYIGLLIGYLLVVILINFYCYQSLKSLWGKKKRAWLYLFNAVSLLVLGLQPLNRLDIHFKTTDWFASFSTWRLAMMSVFILIIFFLMVKDIILLISNKIIHLDRKIEPGRRNFMKNITLVGIAGSSTTMSALGFQHAMNPTIKEVMIPLGKLPSAFDGITIAQISDLHAGIVIQKEYIQNIVNQINERGVDIIAFTGDMIDGEPDHLRKHLAPLKNLHSTYGMFYVTGNHEYYWGIERWLKYIKEELEMEILDNRHQTITKDEKSLIIGGVHDYKMGKKKPGHGSDPMKARGGANEDDCKILLAHQPKSYLEAYRAGFDYMMCGHTHGGQFFPITWLIGFFQPYVRGLHDYKGMKIYVSTGCGHYGPINRLANRSEITIHTLKSISL